MKIIDDLILKIAKKKIRKGIKDFFTLKKSKKKKKNKYTRALPKFLR